MCFVLTLEKSLTMLPIIDLKTPEHDCALDIRNACLEHGFMIIKNHGVPWTLVQDSIDQNRAFFNLPLHQKNQILINEKNRGYTPMFEQNLDSNASNYGDFSEGLYFGREIDDDDPQLALPLHGKNRWPDPKLLPNYREITQKYFVEMHKLGYRLVELVALALGLDKSYFKQEFTLPLFTLRPLHYPPKKFDAEKNSGLGAGAHTDYGLITILVTDGVPGLQIQVNGVWNDVPNIPESFVVNLGDMFYRWTGGRFKSTIHRVQIPTTDRYSIAFFMEPNFHTIIKPIDQLNNLWPEWEADPDSIFWEPISCGSYLLQRYAETRSSNLKKIST